TQLIGVAVLNDCTAWVVGDNFSATQGDIGLIERWDGSAWTQTPNPNPGTATFLAAVRAVSPSDAWAVGDYSTKSVQNTLTVHWDGHSWKRVASPHQLTSSGLVGVGMSSASNAWAVGSTFDTTDSQSLALHWNGHNWQRVATPSPAGAGNNRGELDGVAVTSA